MLNVVVQKQRGAWRLNVEFRLPTPGVVALFGRSGCGKTTLVNIIAGLIEPDNGTVELDGTPLFDSQARITVPPERRRIGYVFQEARLFPHLSVAANLRYGQRRAAGARFVSFDEVMALLGLSALLDRRTHQLSGGERQRVAIGRALLAQPRLLLLDEPLAGLDDARRQEVLPYLEVLRDRLSIPMVYVTHDFNEVLRLATHLVLMDAGAVIAQGELGAMSVDPKLRALVGPDEVGAIVDGKVLGRDGASNLTTVRVGHGELHVQTTHLNAGDTLRVQLLARDIIVSTELPTHLSVRNCLAGMVRTIQADTEDSDLVTLDIGGAHILARITRAATRELRLAPDMPAWALVKSVSLRGHSFGLATRPPAGEA